MTLLQSIDTLIENISVTDKQEENVKNSLSNIESHLKNEESELYVDETFSNGSWDRDTIIRPLDDIDLFAVLNFEKWKDENGSLPNPQSVLTKMKNYLNDQADYKGKVSQNRPCVTIELSNKKFDVLPSFPCIGGGYWIPNHDLKSWTFSDPKQLSTNLDNVHRQRNYMVKPVVKVVKYWNRDMDEKLIPSYHIEEAAISIFTLQSFTNFEEAIRIWFNNAEYYLRSDKFKSNEQYTTALNRVKKVKEKLNDAKKKYDDGEEDDAKQIWKDVFGKEFPSVDVDEAKDFAKSLSDGTLRINSTGTLSKTAGMAIAASKGYFGDGSDK